MDERQKVIAQLEEFLKVSAIDRVEEYLKEQMHIANEAQQFDHYVWLGLQLLSFYQSMERYEDAFGTADDILLLMEELQQDDSVEFGAVLLQLSETAMMAGNLKAAYDNGRRVLQLYECILGTEDPLLIRVCHQMGSICMAQASYEEARLYWTRVVDVLSKEDYRDSESGSLFLIAAHSGLAETYYGQGRLQKSLEAYEAAIAVCRRTDDQSRSMQMLCANAAAICARLGDHEKEAYYASYAQ